ncbi:TadA family conjugal transfer-associated ATPase [Microbacterium sp. YY-03]|uniref:TadA family conjugal transfer-associated ATPase n=1 Tax=Microbacterium sp. YY-03 TaxID=3421636 RepID=UPI003D16F64F
MVEAFVIRAEHVAAPAPPRARVLQPLSRYLDDPDVTDLFINGARGLFVDRGRGSEKDESWGASEREVRDLAVALMAAGDRHIDDAHPCVDVRLEGGVRVHAVLAPIAVDGTTISIRVARMAGQNLAELAAAAMFTLDEGAWLRDAVERRANFLISGAGGSGKTTLLSALLSEAPASERILTIEDVAELHLKHPHHVALESRQATVEGAGAVSLAQLVREALRMRPDRLVIGECRGAEVRELLSALNTGHDGGAGTIHANSMGDVAARLEALGALAGLDAGALARQVVSAMDFVVHLTRSSAGVRRIEAIGSFAVEDGHLVVRRTEPVVQAEATVAAPSGPRDMMTRRRGDYAA